MAHHLSRLQDEVMRKQGEKFEINDAFPYEHVTLHDLILWFEDFANYLESDLVPSDLTFHQWKKFLHDVNELFLG